jgi:UPF0716 family protein affecting phage T7 exclusion
MFFFGWLLIIASAIEVVQAVMVGHWVGFFHHLLAAILFGVIGVILIARPMISAEALTVVSARRHAVRWRCSPGGRSA